MEGPSTGYYAMQFKKPETTGQETSLETGAKINLLFDQLKPALDEGKNRVPDGPEKGHISLRGRVVSEQLFQALIKHSENLTEARSLMDGLYAKLRHDGILSSDQRGDTVRIFQSLRGKYQMLLARSTAGLLSKESALTSKNALRRARQWREDNNLETIGPEKIDAEYRRLSERAEALTAYVTKENAALSAEAEAAPSYREGAVVEPVPENPPEPTDPSQAAPIMDEPLSSETPAASVASIEPPPALTPDLTLATTVTEGLVADEPDGTPVPSGEQSPAQTTVSDISPTNAPDLNTSSPTIIAPSAPDGRSTEPLSTQMNAKIRQFFGRAKNYRRALIAVGILMLGLVGNYAQMVHDPAGGLPESGKGKQPIAIVVPGPVGGGSQDITYPKPFSPWEQVRGSPAQPEIIAEEGGSTVDTESASRNTATPPVQVENDSGSPVRVRDLTTGPRDSVRPLGSESLEVEKPNQREQLPAYDPNIDFPVGIDHPLTKDYVPPLGRLSDYGVRVVPAKINADEGKGQPIAAQALASLFQDAKAAGIEDLFVTSGYRSYNVQRALYNKNRAEHGENQMVSAAPGTSEHQSGLAFDLTTRSIGFAVDLNAGFENTSAGIWLLNNDGENLGRHGFVITYPAFGIADGRPQETWHIRYVGVQIAQELRAQKYISSPGSGKHIIHYLAQLQASYGAVAQTTLDQGDVASRAVKTNAYFQTTRSTKYG